MSATLAQCPPVARNSLASADTAGTSPPEGKPAAPTAPSNIDKLKTRTLAANTRGGKGPTRRKASKLIIRFNNRTADHEHPPTPSPPRFSVTTTHTQTTKSPGRFRLPDPPEREPDDMTSAEHLSETGLHRRLKQFLGNPETTIVPGEKYITARRGAEIRYPDLLVAFNVNPQSYRETNNYVISVQGKPPDLVLEIASEATSGIHAGEKREFYWGILILEYWWFDATGDFHGTRLTNGRYQPMDIAELNGGVLQGHSMFWTWTGDGATGKWGAKTRPAAYTSPPLKVSAWRRSLPKPEQKPSAQPASPPKHAPRTGVQALRRRL